MQKKKKKTHSNKYIKLFLRLIIKKKKRGKI